MLERMDAKYGVTGEAPSVGTRGTTLDDIPSPLENKDLIIFVWRSPHLWISLTCVSFSI